jgi:hypothetical protein
VAVVLVVPVSVEVEAGEPEGHGGHPEGGDSGEDPELDPDPPRPP